MKRSASEINLIIKILKDIPRITSRDAYCQLLDIIREDFEDDGINFEILDNNYYNALKRDYINVLKEALTEAENMEILPY